MGGRSSEGFSANKRFSGFKSCEKKKNLKLNLIPRAYQRTLLSKHKLIATETAMAAKTSLKGEFALLQTLSRLFHLV